MKLPFVFLPTRFAWRISFLLLCCGCASTQHETSALATLHGHSDRVNSIAFSPCGKFLASASSDTSVIVWEIATKMRCQVLRGHEHRLSEAVYSGDGSFLASVSAPVSVVKLWDLATWKQTEELKGTAVAVCRDNKLIALGGSGGSITLWDVEKRKEKITFNGHKSPISALVCAKKGDWLVSGSFANGVVKVWDISREKEHVTLDKEKAIPFFSRTTCLAISPDGNVIGTGHYDGTIRLWKVDTPEMLRVIKGHDSHVLGIAFNSDGTALVSGSSDKTVKVWRVSGGDPVGVFKGHSDAVSSVAFSNDGGTVASASYDETVKLWDVSGIKLNDK